MYSIIQSTVKSSYGMLYQKLMLKIKHQSHTQLSKWHMAKRRHGRFLVPSYPSLSICVIMGS